MWVGVIPASPAPVTGSGSWKHWASPAFPSGESGAGSQGQKISRKEKEGLRLESQDTLCKKMPSLPPTGIQNWKEKEEAGEGCLSPNHCVARTKLIRSGSLR